MTEVLLSSDPAAAEANMELLSENEYPGRIALMGISPKGDQAFQVYALMGRSEGSRNRIFIESPETGDIRTTAPDKTPEEMKATKHAELIYYPAMQTRGGVHVVSNGAQTTPILEKVFDGYLPQDAVERAPVVEEVDLSTYEPDAPNFTPRITGVVDLRAEAIIPFGLFVARRGVLTTQRDEFFVSDLNDLTRGVGYTIQTYAGNAPAGEALPSFDRGEPYTLPLSEGLQETAHQIWSTLNRDNRVALVAKSIDLESGATVGQEIINAKQ